MFKFQLKEKIIVLVSSLMIVSMVLVALIVSFQAVKWFNEEANDKLSLSVNMLLRDIEGKIHAQQKSLGTIVNDENLIAPVTLVADIINENPTEFFEDAYEEARSAIIKANDIVRFELSEPLEDAKFMLDELEQALDALEQQNELSCLIITGSGDRAFAVGVDIAAMSAMSSNGNARRL